MGFLKGVADWFRNNVPLVGPAIADAIEAIEAGIENWTSFLWEVARRAHAFLSWLWINIEEAGKRLGKLLQDFWWQISSFFENLFYQVSIFFEHTWKFYRDLISDIAKAWSDFVRDPWGIISKAIESIWSAIYDRVRPYVDELSRRIGEVRADLFRAVGELFRFTTSALNELNRSIGNLQSQLNSAVAYLGARIEETRRALTEWLNGLAKSLQQLWDDFRKYVATSVVFWEAAKNAARRRVAKEIADVLERPETQAALIGGETGAWIANPGVGAAVTGTLLSLEAWSFLAREVPVGVQIRSDNPIVDMLFRDEEIELEGPVEFNFGEALESEPAVIYVWPDVRAGRYDPEFIVRE